MSYKVPFIRGATKDRDFLHWRMAPYSILAADAELRKSFPAAFTLEQMLLMSWRIRKMKLSGTYTYDFTVYSGMGASQAGTMTITFNNIIIPVQKQTPIFIPGGGGAPVQGHDDATAEPQIMDFPNPKLRRWHNPGSGYVEIVPPAAMWGPLAGDILLPVGGNAGFTGLQRTLDTPAIATKSVSGTGISFWPQTSPFLSNISEFSQLLGYQPPPNNHGLPQEQVFFDPITKLFYPFIYLLIETDIFINFTSGGSDWGPYRQRSSVSTNPGAGSPPNVGVLNLFDADIPLYLVANPPATGFTPVPQPIHHDLTLTIEADKYWKFKNGAGQDVYDETSGAQINDPYA